MTLSSLWQRSWAKYCEFWFLIDGQRIFCPMKVKFWAVSLIFSLQCFFLFLVHFTLRESPLTILYPNSRFFPLFRSLFADLKEKYVRDPTRNLFLPIIVGTMEICPFSSFPKEEKCERYNFFVHWNADGSWIEILILLLWSSLYFWLISSDYLTFSIMILRWNRKWLSFKILLYVASSAQWILPYPRHWLFFSLTARETLRFEPYYYKYE